jgi:hypothetical protein
MQEKLLTSKYILGLKFTSSWKIESMRVKEEGNGLAKTFKLWLFFFTKYSFSCDIGTWNPGPVLTKQVLYH